MALQLDNIFLRIGMWRLHKKRHRFINDSPGFIDDPAIYGPLRAIVSQFAPTGWPEYRRGHLYSPFSAHANDTNAALAHGSGNGTDCISLLHTIYLLHKYQFRSKKGSLNK